MRFVISLCVLLNVAVPAAAGGRVSFQDLVVLSEQRPAYVSAVALGISSRCLQSQWGNDPPKALRDWFTALLVSDLENRAKVTRGKMSQREAGDEREQLFLSLAQLKPHEFDAVAVYAGFTPEAGFGPALTDVFECQYKSLAKALAKNIEKI
jgi:hypothetical protein